MKAIEEGPLEANIFATKRSDEIRDSDGRGRALAVSSPASSRRSSPALERLGGRITEREDRRYEITRVPGSVRSFATRLEPRSPLSTSESPSRRN